MGIIEHRVNAGFGNERLSGWVVGLDAARQLGTRVQVQLIGRGAELAGELDRRIGDIEARAHVAVRPWWGVYSGLTIRAVSNGAARQRWHFARIGAEVRPSFTGGRVRAVGRLGVIPAAAVKGLPAASLAVDGAVGLDYERAGVSLELLYGVERFGFPTENGVRRSEQLSTLTLRAGIRLVRRP